MVRHAEPGCGRGQKPTPARLWRDTPRNPHFSHPHPKTGYTLWSRTHPPGKGDRDSSVLWCRLSSPRPLNVSAHLTKWGQKNQRRN